jgi:hypothetical protein
MTVVELLLAMTLLAAVLGVPAMLLRSGSSAYAVENASAETAELARTGIDRIVTRLETSIATSFGVAPIRSNSVSYQRSIGFLAGALAPAPGPTETIQFEYTATDADDGIDNDGDGLIDEGRVVWLENPGAANERRVSLVEGVVETFPGEIPGNGVDDNGNGMVDESGLWFDVQVGRITVYLGISRPGPGGSIVTRQLRRVIAFRN